MDVLLIAGTGFGVAAFIAACLLWNRISYLEAEMSALESKVRLLRDRQAALWKQRKEE